MGRRGLSSPTHDSSGRTGQDQNRRGSSSHPSVEQTARPPRGRGRRSRGGRAARLCDPTGRGVARFAGGNARSRTGGPVSSSRHRSFARSCAVSRSDPASREAGAVVLRIPLPGSTERLRPRETTVAPRPRTLGASRGGKMSVRTGRVCSCLLDQSADGDDVSTAIHTVASVTDGPFDTDSTASCDSDSLSASIEEDSIEASAQAMLRERCSCCRDRRWSRFCSPRVLGTGGCPRPPRARAWPTSTPPAATVI